MYYEVEELNSLLEGHDKLIVFHQNIRSFNCNYDSLSCFLKKLKCSIDVIILTETWFSEGLCQNIEGYKAYHTYRSNRTGGGISIYVKKNLCSSAHENLSNTDNFCESCVVEISPNIKNTKENITIFGIYRPPNSSLPIFIDYINNVLTEHSQKSIAFIGDFNIDILDDDAGADFSNLMYSRNFFPFINIPTRVTEQSSKCLDHIWYNRHNSLFSGAFITDITDHYPIFTVLNVAKKKLPLKKLSVIYLKRI